MHRNDEIKYTETEEALILDAYQDKEKRKHSLQVPETKKNYLKSIQTNFSPNLLDYKDISYFGREEDLFIYSNDAKYIYNYYQICYKNHQKLDAKKTKIAGNSEFNLLDSLIKKPEKHKIGIIVGNGNILSLLPDIEAEDIILLDIEPAVLYFVLSIRNIILDANDNEDFFITKNKIIFEIIELKNKIDPSRRDDGINDEIQLLGDKHFLSSKLRFDQCKKSLNTKELLPIKMDIFNRKYMSKFIQALKLAACKVSFMNLTNIGDYDESHSLTDILSDLPITKSCKIITTSLVGYESKNQGNRCYVSTSLKQLEDNLQYSYFRNTKSYSFGYSFG